MTHFWNFGTPLISRGRIKLETSNLAYIWMAESANEKTQNLVKRGHVGVTSPTFVILGPPNILRMYKARNFKFGTDMVCSEY